MGPPFQHDPNPHSPEYLLTSDKSSDKTPEIRILTYNFYIRPPFVSEITGDFKDERLQLFIDTVLDDYDIIAFQECFGSYSSRRFRLIQAAAKRGLKYVVEGPGANWLRGKIVDSGLLLLSRFPIVNSDIVTYHAGSTVDRLAAKGSIYARIQISTSNFLHLFNTHFQASYSTAPPIDDPSVLVRLAQLQQWKSFIHESILPFSEEISDGHDAVVVMGDLNINSMQKGQKEYLKLLDILEDISIIPGNSDDKKVKVKMKALDLLIRDTGIHPITQVPWSYLSQPRMSTFSKTVEDEHGSRLDYIIQLKPLTDGMAKEGVLETENEIGFSNDTTEMDDLITKCRLEALPRRDKSEIDFSRTKVEPFSVKGRSFIQLSDHRGVSTMLTILIAGDYKKNVGLKC